MEIEPRPPLSYISNLLHYHSRLASSSHKWDYKKQSLTWGATNFVQHHPWHRKTHILKHKNTEGLWQPSSYKFSGITQNSQSFITDIWRKEFPLFTCDSENISIRPQKSRRCATWVIHWDVESMPSRKLCSPRCCYVVTGITFYWLTAFRYKPLATRSPHDRITIGEVWSLTVVVIFSIFFVSTTKVIIICSLDSPNIIIVKGASC